MPAQVVTSVDKTKAGLPLKEYMRQWYTKRKDFRKEEHLRKNYGITVDDLLEMMEDQNNLCAICKKDLKSLTPKNVHIDHCHKSNEMKIRGVLCNKCNMALGLLNDDVELFKTCIKYLSR